MTTTIAAKRSAPDATATTEAHRDAKRKSKEVCAQPMRRLIARLYRHHPLSPQAKQFSDTHGPYKPLDECGLDEAIADTVQHVWQSLAATVDSVAVFGVTTFAGEGDPCFRLDMDKARIVTTRDYLPDDWHQFANTSLPNSSLRRLANETSA